MNHLADFLNVVSWFWFVLSAFVLVIMCKTSNWTNRPRWYNKPLIWAVILTASLSWLIIPDTM